MALVIRELTYANLGPVTLLQCAPVSSSEPTHLLRHHDELGQGEAAVEVGLGPGQEEPGQVRPQLVAQLVSGLQDDSPQADMTDVPGERGNT